MRLLHTDRIASNVDRSLCRRYKLIDGVAAPVLWVQSDEPASMNPKKENGAFGTLSRVHDCHVHHAIHIARRPGPAAAEQVSVAKPINADQQTGVGCIKP